MKENHIFSEKLFLTAPVIGIMRNMSFETVKKILPVYVAAGFTTIEITMNTPGATQMIEYAVNHYGEKLNIGAGTVCTLNDLESALTAGAQFIVSPVINEAVISNCVVKRIPVFPGAYTPTEIYRCWLLGAYMVKVFPATITGPGYIREVKAPLNDIRLLPTGGVDLDNIHEFFKAGASGVGIGSHLFDKGLIAAGDWEGLQKHLGQFLNKVPKTLMR